MIYYYYTYKEGTALSKEKKLAKKEAKAAKREAKAEKALAKANAKAEKKHAKAYEKFVKETTKKNEKGEKKAAAGGKAFTAIAIPTIDVPDLLYRSFWRVCLQSRPGNDGCGRGNKSGSDLRCVFQPA